MTDRIMFHVKHWKKNVALFMCAVLLCFSMAKPLQTKAVVPLVLTAWEVIQILLLSAGVTYETYTILDNAIPDEFKEEWCNQFMQQLNDAKEGVGDTVQAVIDSVKMGTVTTMTMARTAWDGFRDALNTIFNGSDVTDLGGQVAYNITTAEQLLRVLGLPQDEAESLSANVEELCEQLTAHGTKLSVFVATMNWEYVGNKLYMMLLESPVGLTFTGTYTELSRKLAVEISSRPTAYMQIQYSFDTAQWSVLDTYRDWTMSGNTYTWWNILPSPLPAVQTLMVGSDVQIKTKAKVNPGYQSLLEDKDKVLVTPGSQVVDGTLTGDLIWTIPAEIADILEGVKDGVIAIPDALENLKVIPVDKTDTKEIEDAIDKVGTITIPDTPTYDGDYTLNLASFFPFCLPFDFADMIGCLQATPQAPKFTFKLPVGYSSGGAIWQEFTIDFSDWDRVAAVARTGELLVFIVGLVMITRSQFIRG